MDRLILVLKVYCYDMQRCLLDVIICKFPRSLQWRSNFMPECFGMNDDVQFVCCYCIVAIARKLLNDHACTVLDCALDSPEDDSFPATNLPTYHECE